MIYSLKKIYTRAREKANHLQIFFRFFLVTAEYRLFFGYFSCQSTNIIRFSEFSLRLLMNGSEPLVLALARAFRWQKYIDEGMFRNITEHVKAIGQDKAVTASIMRLRFLSSVIMHRIVTGDIPRSITLSSLKTAFPVIMERPRGEMDRGKMILWGGRIVIDEVVGAEEKQPAPLWTSPWWNAGATKVFDIILSR